MVEDRGGMKLINKTIWITGASSGIGEALVQSLAQEEVNLIISARRASELERVKSENQGKAKIESLPLDLEKCEELKAKADQALRLFGQIDILINNGGVSQRSMAMDSHLDIDRKIMEINFLGTITLTKPVVAHMLERGSGLVATVTSVTGKFGTPWRSSYAASKHALHGFFDSMRAELEDKGVKFTLLALGFIGTKLSQVALKGDGSPNGSVDETHKRGIAPDVCARKILKAIKKEKREVYIGKEAYAVYVKRFFPGVFARLIKTAKVR